MAVVEQSEEMYGGTCINVACIPSKSLVKNAERASRRDDTKEEQRTFYKQAIREKILGAMLFCEASHEMINLLKLAMDVEADYTILRDFIYTHPTMSEALNELLQS